MTSSPKPPLLARALLACFLPEDARDDISGDLLELYQQRRARAGVTGAHLWYWREVLSFSVRFLVERVARHFRASAVVPVSSARMRPGRGQALVDSLRQDVMFAARSLLRTPVVSLTIIVTLALGLGVNAAMFSMLDVIFLRPPTGVAAPDGVRRLWAHVTFRRGAQFWSGYDYASYAAVQQSLAGKADLAVYQPPWPLPLGKGENPSSVRVVGASATYFAILGVRPALGRFYSDEEDRLNGGAPVAVLSDRMWRRMFGADPGVLGRQIDLQGTSFTVIGIAPRGFSGVDLDATDAWLPLASHPDYARPARTPWYQNPNINAFQILMRLPSNGLVSEIEQRATLALRQPGLGYRQDTTAVARLGSIVKARGPGEISGEVQVAERAGGVAIIVLLIAFANVVNLLLARTVRRSREIAVRLALGISRTRLLRLLMTESVLLSLTASVAALVGAWYGGTLLRTLLMPEIEWANDPLHWRVLLLGVAAAIAVGICAGLVPALSRAPDLTRALKSGVREGGARRSRLRGFLVASQAALSVVLIVGAALFVRSLSNVRALDIGYAVNRLAFVSVARGPDQTENAAVSNRLRELEGRIAGIPGVEQVAYTLMRPKWGIQFTTFFPDAPSGLTERSGSYSAVSPGFFDATGTRILRGRTFASGGAGSSERSVLINQAMTDSLWPDSDPLGRCIRFKAMDAPCYTIVGVTQTALFIEVNEKPEPHVYLPLDNMPFAGRSGVGDVVLRVEPAQLTLVLHEVRELFRREFPGRAVTTNTMAAAMEPEYRPWYLGAALFSLFGILAAVVAAIGVYSSVSYAVSQRTHEFGVRVALGATGRTIVRQVVGDGLRIVAMGVMAGILLALAAGRIIASLLYDVSPENPVAMLLAAGALLAIAAVASFAPAWRAGRADPVTALRTD
ncbi:MAG: ADOP family duplicated permease [Gemmatimonadaceae bacterium]